MGEGTGTGWDSVQRSASSPSNMRRIDADKVVVISIECGVGQVVAWVQVRMWVQVMAWVQVRMWVFHEEL